MARIRTIKPEMAKHEALFDLEVETGLPIRFAWAMLPTACDREGRFQWRPRTLKADVLPHDDVDFSRVLHAWLTRGFVVRYRVGHEWFGWLPTFRKHQVINVRETASVLPSIEDAEEVEDYRNQELPNASTTRDPPVNDASSTRAVHARGERKGRGRERNKPPLPPFDPSSVPNLNLTAWQQWVAYRTQIRKPLKPASMQAAAEAMAKLGNLQAESVQQSIANGWQGLFEPKARQRPGGPMPDDLEREALRKLADRRPQIGLGDFRDPLPGESAKDYRAAQDAEWNARKRQPLPAVIGSALRALP